MKRASLKTISQFLLVALATAFSVASPRQTAAQDPDYALTITDAAGPVGFLTKVAVSLRGTALDMYGFEFAVCDDALVEMDFGDVELGSAINERLIEHLHFDFDDGSWTMAVLFTSGAGGELVIGETHEVAVASYQMLELGVSELTFCASVLEPVVITASGDIEPVVTGSTITIEEPKYFLRGDINGDGRVIALQEAKYLIWAPYDSSLSVPCTDSADVNDSSDGNPLGGLGHGISGAFTLLRWQFEGGSAPPAPGPDECGVYDPLHGLPCEIGTDPCPAGPLDLPDDPTVSVRFGLALETLPVGGGFELPILLVVEGEFVDGVQFGVCNDSGIALDDSTDTPVTENVHNTGSLYHGVQIFEDGWTAGVLISLLDETVHFETGQNEVCRASYVVEEEGPASISFCETLGSPPVEFLALRVFDLLGLEMDDPFTVTGVRELDDGLSFIDGEGVTGGSAEVGIVMTNADAEISAWHWGVCNDSLVSIAAGNVALAGALEGVPFSMHTLRFYADGWTVNAIVDLASGSALPAGETRIAYVARYQLDQGGISTLSFCDSLGGVSVGWKADGVEESPPTSDGSIRVQVADPYTFHARVEPFSYDPDGVPDEMSFQLELSIAEDQLHFGYPTSTGGFQMAIGHDPKVLTVAGGEPVGAVAALNAGAGPEFVSLEIDPPGGSGATISLIYSLDGSVTLDFATESNVFQLQYQLTSAALAGLEGSSDGLSTSFEWRSDLGDPAVRNSVRVDDEWVDAAAESYLLLILPKGSFAPFLRGDCDGNGTVSAISDALFLLHYGFTAGENPPCRDAADVDDSGVVFAITDTLYLLGWGYLSGAAPPAPGPTNCGNDPTEDLVDCATPPASCL